MLERPNIGLLEDRYHSLAQNYPMRILNAREGLPSNQVHRIAQDASKRIWAATPAGLASFDGVRISIFDQNQGLGTQGIRAVAADESGYVFVGTDLGLDVVEPDLQIRPVIQNAEWTHGFVERLVVSSDQVWISTSFGLVVWDRAKSRLETGLEVQVPELVNDMVLDDQDRLWVSSQQMGLGVLENGKFRSISKLNRSIGKVICFYRDPDLGILGGGERGIWLFSGDGKATQWMSREECGGTVTALLRFKDELWVAAGGNLLAFESGPGGWVTKAVAKTNIRINHLITDHQGNIWVASNNSGILRISVLRLSVCQIVLPEQTAILSVTPSENGTVRIGGDGTSYDIQTEPGWRAKTIDLFQDHQIWDIIETANGDQWYATNFGIFQVSGKGLDKGKPHRHLSFPGRAFLEMDDLLLAATVKGLFVFKGNRNYPVYGLSGNSLGYVYTLTGGKEGNAWVGTLGLGLWQTDGEIAEPVVREHLSHQGNTYCISENEDGRLLVVQNNQVIILEAEGGPSRLLVKSNEPVAGWCCTWGRDSQVWVGSGCGLVEYDSNTGRECRRVTTEFGSLGFEFTSSRSLSFDGKGRFLCGLGFGLVRVDPLGIQHIPPLPRPSLHEVCWTNALFQERKKNIFEVFHGNWKVRVGVSCHWYIADEELKYRFRLIGFDSDWSQLNKAPVVDYNSLPPGEYTLECQAFSALAGWSQPHSLLDCTVKAPRWAGFLLPVVHLMSKGFLNLVGGYQRNRRLQRLNDRLEAKIQERTENLMEANKALSKLNAQLHELSTTDELTQIANRRLFLDQFGKELERANRGNMALSLLILDVDHFKNINDSYGHPVGDMVLRYLGSLLRKETRNSLDLVARIGGEEFGLILPQCQSDEIKMMAERLRQLIGEQPISINDDLSITLTVSIGGVTYHPKKNEYIQSSNVLMERLFSSCDQALYQAKETGRNRVVIGGLNLLV